jgi:ribosomal protein S27E
MTTIHFERSGGFIGRKLSVTLDLDSLPAAQAESIRTMLAATDFFSLPETSAAPLAPDEFSYRITVETGVITHAVQFTETSASPELHPLVDQLETIAKNIKSTDQGNHQEEKKAEFVTLTCPSCGGKLNIRKDLERIACEFCGNEHLVHRYGGTVALQQVLDTIAQMKAELSLSTLDMDARRLREEIARLIKDLENPNRASMTAGGLAVMFVGLVLIVSAFSNSTGWFLFGVALAILGSILTLLGLERSEEETRLEAAIKEKRAELREVELLLKKKLQQG